MKIASTVNEKTYLATVFDGEGIACRKRRRWIRRRRGLRCRYDFCCISHDRACGSVCSGCDSYRRTTPILTSSSFSDHGIRWVWRCKSLIVKNSFEYVFSYAHCCLISVLLLIVIYCIHSHTPEHRCRCHFRWEQTSGRRCQLHSSYKATTPFSNLEHISLSMHAINV